VRTETLEDWRLTVNITPHHSHPSTAQGRRLYILKVFIECHLNLGSGGISMFSVNVTFDKTLMMQFCYFFLQKSPLFGL